MLQKYRAKHSSKPSSEQGCRGKGEGSPLLRGGRPVSAPPTRTPCPCCPPPASPPRWKRHSSPRSPSAPLSAARPAHRRPAQHSTVESRSKLTTQHATVVYTRMNQDHKYHVHFVPHGSLRKTHRCTAVNRRGCAHVLETRILLCPDFTAAVTLMQGWSLGEQNPSLACTNPPRFLTDPPAWQKPRSGQLCKSSTLAGGPRIFSSTSGCEQLTPCTMTASRRGVVSTDTSPCASRSLCSSAGTDCLQCDDNLSHDSSLV